MHAHSTPVPLPGPLRARAEHFYRADFSEVRLSFDGLPARLGAVAVARGDTIHLDPAAARLPEPVFVELVGHELAHVVQQRRGRVEARASIGGVAVDDDEDLEREARDLGRRFAHRPEDRPPPAGEGRHRGAPIAQRAVSVAGTAVTPPGGLSERGRLVLALIDGGMEWLGWATSHPSVRYDFADETQLVSAVQSGIHASPLMLLPRIGLWVSPVKLMHLRASDLRTLIRSEHRHAGAAAEAQGQKHEEHAPAGTAVEAQAPKKHDEHRHAGAVAEGQTSKKHGEQRHAGTEAQASKKHGEQRQAGAVAEAHAHKHHKRKHPGTVVEAQTLKILAEHGIVTQADLARVGDFLDELGVAQEPVLSALGLDAQIAIYDLILRSQGDAAQQPDLQQEAAAFAVMQARTPFEFVDFYKFYIIYVTKLGLTGSARATEANAAVQLLQPLLFGALDGPQIITPAGPREVARVVNGWLGVGKQLGFARLSTGVEQIIENSRFTRETGEAAKAMVNGYLREAQEFLALNEPSGALLGQDGVTCVYPVEGEGARAEIELGASGVLTLRSFSAAPGAANGSRGGQGTGAGASAGTGTSTGTSTSSGSGSGSGAGAASGASTGPGAERAGEMVAGGVH